MMRSPIILIALLAAMCLPLNEFLNLRGGAKSFNEFIDETLKNFRNEPSLVRRLEPYRIGWLPPMYFSFPLTRKRLQLSDVELSGLTRLYRSGDCHVQDHGGKVTITGEMGVRGVRVGADYNLSPLLFVLDVSGRLEGGVERLKVRFRVSITKTDEVKLHLDSFEILDMSNFKLWKITGLSIFDDIVRFIINLIIPLFKRKIVDIVERTATTSLRKILGNLISHLNV